MRFDFSLNPAVLLGLAALSTTAHAICGSGEVAVGNSQLCGLGTPNSPACGGDFGVVLANNCNTITSSWKESYCSGQWSSGGSVNCNGNGDAVTVDTTGGRFGWCYRVNDRSCSRSIGISTVHINIDWCCKRL